MRIGLLTSGGDCQSLNAMMQSICKSIYRIDPECQIYGFIDGYQGLQHGEYNIYQCDDFFDLLYRGGTVLGTSRTSFKNIVKSKHVVDAMVNTYNDCHLDCLLALGGNGSQKTSNLLAQKGCNVIALPKTIDNDLYLTDMTFGFMSAFEATSKVMESIYTTAASHNRIFAVEVMGHKTGWLALYTGLACQANMILLPEIPYDKKVIFENIKNRDRYKPYIIVVAEGAISKEDSVLTKREFKEKRKYTQSAMKELRFELKKELNENLFTNTPGHIQRGGRPSSVDLLLVSRLGSYVGQMIQNQEFGMMLSIQNDQIVKVPLENVAGKLKFVNLDNPMIEEARNLGISFGDKE